MAEDAPALTLQLLPEPRAVQVETEERRDHLAPAAYRERGGPRVRLLHVAGPDRLSGGHWEDEPWAREYFRAVTEAGRLVWLFRDARADRWFLHGWWD